MTTFQLNPSLDLEALAREYQAAGRVRVHGLLAGDAVDELYVFLHGNEDWWQLINTPSGIIELDRGRRAEMDAEELAALDAGVHANARFGFQYRYEGLRVPDDEDDLESKEDSLASFCLLYTSPSPRDS